MKRTVMVTGGAGLVGSHLVESLLRDGHEVTVFDALLRPGSRANSAWLRHRYPDSQLTFIKGDVKDLGAFQAAMKNSDVIYHLAAQVAVTSSVSDPRSTSPSR